MAATAVGVVARSFVVLRCFDETHARLTLSELARRSGLPINTALRIARGLVAERALERDESGRFRIGLGLWEIATLAERGIGLRTAAIPYLTDLQELTGHHALLSVREGDEGLLIERASPRGRRLDIEYRIGGRLPLASTGGGLVLLAFAPDDVRRRALHVAELATGAGPRAAEDLRQRLSVVRRTDSAIERRAARRPLLSAGVPVRDGAGAVVAALSVVIPEGDGDVASVIPALHACARAIRRDVRGRVDGGGAADR